MKKYILIALSLLTLAACNSKKEQVLKTEKVNPNVITLTNAQLNTINLELVRVSKANLPLTMQLNARTEVTPQDKVSVLSMMGGFVKSINVLPGTTVKKGQLLAVIEDPSFVQLQEDYLTTKVSLIKANANYARQRELYDSQAVSIKVLEEAKVELNLLQIKKRALEEKLKLIKMSPSNVSVNNIHSGLSILSPVSGVVNEVFVNRGQYVSSSQTIIDIIQSGTPMLNIKAFENNLPYIRVGQEIEAFTNQMPNKKVKAKIMTISQHVNGDGTVDILAKIANTNNLHIATNMYFNINLTYNSVASVVLPKEAVVQFEEQNYIYEKVGKNTFKKQSVKIGVSTNNIVEIVSPIDTSKQYVGKGAYALLMAMKNSVEE